MVEMCCAPRNRVVRVDQSSGARGDCGHTELDLQSVQHLAAGSVREVGDDDLAQLQVEADGGVGAPCVDVPLDVGEVVRFERLLPVRVEEQRGEGLHFGRYRPLRLELLVHVLREDELKGRLVGAFAKQFQHFDEVVDHVDLLHEVAFLGEW